MHRLLTFVWCLVMVAVLGVGSEASAREAVAQLSASELRTDPPPDSRFGMPPATGEVGEDAESEEKGGDDNVDRPDSRWGLELSSGLLAATCYGHLALRSSQAFGRRQHNRGPPA